MQKYSIELLYFALKLQVTCKSNNVHHIQGIKGKEPESSL